MKSWWRTTVKDYFTFSKKERIGIIVILVITVSCYLFSRYYPINQPAPIPKDAFQKELAQLNITIDSSTRNYSRYRDDDHEDYMRPKYKQVNTSTAGELFAFDPNTLDANGWKRLGVKEKTIETIQKFIAKGYRFQQPADIRKIYGLQSQLAEKLEPYVTIKNEQGQVQPTQPNVIPALVASTSRKEDPNIIIDINTADTSQFIALPGIGSKLANRIVVYREKLGGFVSVNQVGETFGLPDSTFQKIKPWLRLATAAVAKININTAEIDQLKAHPYIRWHLANAIVNYKQQHGNYKSLDDLKRLNLITEEVFNKLSPYIAL